MLLEWNSLCRFSDRPLMYGNPMGGVEGLEVFLEESWLVLIFFFGSLNTHFLYPLASSACLTCFSSFCFSSEVEGMLSALWRSVRIPPTSYALDDG